MKKKPILRVVVTDEDTSVEINGSNLDITIATLNAIHSTYNAMNQHENAGALFRALLTAELTMPGSKVWDEIDPEKVIRNEGYEVDAAGLDRLKDLLRSAKEKEKEDPQ